LTVSVDEQRKRKLKNATQPEKNTSFPRAEIDVFPPPCPKLN
jgi:hypothetical protein